MRRSCPSTSAIPSAVQPEWARLVAGVVAELRPESGAIGTVSTDLPIGSGLSSSASLEVAVALALGFVGDALDLAKLCQRAEHRAVGVPCGIMDQLAITVGVEGALLLLDCDSLEARPIPFPDAVSLVCIDSGQRRLLAGSAYAERHAECQRAEREIGPLRTASLADVERLRDPRVRRRARHVVNENRRVLDFVQAIDGGQFSNAGTLLLESHASLSADFEVTTSLLDELVAKVAAMPGVYGARMTGAGFGGYVIALCDPDATAVHLGWPARPATGTRVRSV